MNHSFKREGNKQPTNFFFLYVFLSFLIMPMNFKSIQGIPTENDPGYSFFLSKQEVGSLDLN